MREFKTQKGTILPLLDLKGKPYLQVAHRLVWFREEHPEASIKTEFVQLDKDISICKASIWYGDKIMSTAHKREDSKGFYDHTEKSETGAIGRALALLGYGTQFCADDLNEGDRLADSPITPYVKPMDRPVDNTPPMTPIMDGNGFAPSYYVVPFGKFAKRTLEELDPKELASYIAYLEDDKRKGYKPPTGAVLDFILRAAEYLGALENNAASYEDAPF